MNALHLQWADGKHCANDQLFCSGKHWSVEINSVAGAGMRETHRYPDFALHAMISMAQS